MAYSTELNEFSDRFPISALVNVLDERVGKSLFAADQNTYSTHIAVLPLIRVRLGDAQIPARQRHSFKV